MTGSVDISAPREHERAAPLLLTKLHAPTRRDQTVERERLFERLRPKPGVKLTVVAAPAGSGKTTLLGQWRDRESVHRPVAWVSVDEGDNDVAVLWAHVLESLRLACPEIRAGWSDVISAPRIVDVVLRELVNELAAQDDVALILDDFHRLSSGGARDSIAWLVEHAPATFQLVLATRREPALALGVLRAHGELVELRADELGFTSDEADELLNTRLALRLERADVDRLVERIEGWPAGLYLAGLSLAWVDDRHAFVDTFGGTSRHVVDFLVDEVLDAHDPETQTLMLRSSILERLSGPLCDAVLEREGSADLLEALSRFNLFLLPLDDRGEWYRFHQLFAQLLRVELEHREPGLARELHRRAFVWHRDHGDVDVAIQHAVKAEAFEEAGLLVAESWVEHANLGRHATVLAWLDRFGREQLRDDGNLLTARAWVLALAGDREASAEAIAELERHGDLDAGPLPDGFSSFESSLATLRATISWGETRKALEHAYRAVELEAPESPWWPAACGALGTNLYFDGRPAEADPWLAQAAELAPARRQWRVAISALATRSLVAGDLARLDDQAAFAAQAARIARERGLEEVEGDALIASGAALVAQGNVRQGLWLLDRGATVLRAFGHPRKLANGLIHRAAALKALHAWEAQAAIVEARVAVEACPDPGALVVWLGALERRPQGRPARASELSGRELVILRMLKGRLSERDIGRELYLSYNTIHSHTRSIYRKLGVSSRAEALAHAHERGLI